jgi:hypothetical protein
MHDLIATQTGGSAAEVGRQARVADAGSRLLEALADNAGLLDAPPKRRELARRLANAGSQAKAWLAEKPTPPTAAIAKVRLLCFENDRRLVPCRVQPP